MRKTSNYITATLDNDYSNWLVDMEWALQETAIDYRLPYLEFDKFVQLACRVIKVYDISDKGKTKTFPLVCEKMKEFIKTPFGKQALKEILSN